MRKINTVNFDDFIYRNTTVNDGRAALQDNNLARKFNFKKKG